MLHHSILHWKVNVDMQPCKNLYTSQYTSGAKIVRFVREAQNVALADKFLRRKTLLCRTIHENFVLHRNQLPSTNLKQHIFGV